MLLINNYGKDKAAEFNQKKLYQHAFYNMFLNLSVVYLYMFKLRKNGVL